MAQIHESKMARPSERAGQYAQKVLDADIVTDACLQQLTCGLPRDPPAILATRRRSVSPESPRFFSRGVVSLVTAKREPSDVE